MRSVLSQWVPLEAGLTLFCLLVAVGRGAGVQAAVALAKGTGICWACWPDQVFSIVRLGFTLLR